MAIGGWAMGLGQGLQNAGQSVGTYEALKQQALQNALAQRQMSLQEQNQKDQRGLQAWSQAQGGAEVSPEDFAKYFAGTPVGAVGFDKPRPNFQENAQVGLGVNPKLPQAPTQNYTTRESLPQYRAETTANAGITKANITQSGANDRTAATIKGAADRNAASNATRERISKAQQTVETAMNAARVAATNARTGVERQRAETALAALGNAKLQLQIHALDLQSRNKLGAARIESSPGYVNADLLSNIKDAQGNALGEAPTDVDTADIDKSLDAILATLGGGAAVPSPAPGKAPVAKPKAPTAAPAAPQLPTWNPATGRLE